MKDWRVIENLENFYKNLELIEVNFPTFWKESFCKKNDFYRMVEEDAVSFVNKYNRGREYLERDSLQDFWHEHCIFCTKKISTRQKMVCYCTKDFNIWICQECYNDFRNKFNFYLLDKI